MTDDKWISFINWHYFDNDCKILNQPYPTKSRNERVIIRKPTTSLQKGQYTCTKAYMFRNTTPTFPLILFDFKYLV